MADTRSEVLHGRIANAAAARDEGLRRLRIATRATVVGAVATAGAFAGIAAASVHGRKLTAAPDVRAAPRRSAVRAAKPAQHVPGLAPVPKLVPVSSAEQPPPPAPPPAPPAAAQAPPVAVTGAS
jgi:hypothetical protein